LRKKTVDYIDRSYTWHVDYNEKSDDVFGAGDHAVPGVYTRETFANYKTVIEDNR